jgi:hypothetical protein
MFPIPNRTQLVATALVSLCYFFSREPVVSNSERAELASGFRFVTQEIVVLPFATDGLKTTTAVHPSLKRISAWISGTRAAATLADLDNDGLENDLVLVDPRVNRVVVMPVPGSEYRTGGEAAQFALDLHELPYNESSMSPSGSLVGDFNEDGLPDILVYYWGRTPVLFLRRATEVASKKLSADQFFAAELVPELVGKRKGLWYTHAATQSDLDGDGHLDLVIGNFFQDGADVLNEHGTGVATVMHAGKSRARNGGGAKLFQWSHATIGDRPVAVYRDRSAALEEHCGKGWVLAMGAADLDQDGLPDLYIAHDFGPDRLLHNRSRPNEFQFAVCEGTRHLGSPRSCVLGQDSFKGMGVGFGDVNGDGYFDIFVSNIADDWALQESHFLWVSTGEIRDFQNGRAPYEQESERYGVSRSGWGWDSVLFDLNNDGDLEALQATGFAKGKVTRESELSFIDNALYSWGFLERGINRWPELQAVGTTNDRLIHDPRAWPKMERPGATLSGYDKNPIYVRSRSGRFADISEQVGLGETYNTRGVAVADSDGDGLLDFVYANQWEPSVFIRNQSPSRNAFLSLRLVMPTEETQFVIDPPTTHGRPAIGATAKLKLVDSSFLSTHSVMIGQINGGSGHSGHGTQEIHFGLGKLPTSKIAVELRWRDQRGNLNSKDVELTPGRHVVVLGKSE